MNELKPQQWPTSIDEGLIAVCQVAAYYRIAADPGQLRHELALGDRLPRSDDLVRGSHLLRLNARILRNPSESRLKAVPTPAIVPLKNQRFALLGAPDAEGRLRLIDPLTRVIRMLSYAELSEEWDGAVILVSRRVGVGVDPKTFGFHWFLPSLWRYRKPLSYVLIASLFIQLFALVTPLFFQIVVDKVLVHKGTSTLVVVTIGLVSLGLFQVTLQYLRAYILSHSANRIDVELGARLFYHLLRLPLLYFETRAAGQTVARVRELETVRSFLTGQGLFSAIDLLFTTILIAVLFAYSSFMALMVLCTAPIYVLIAALLRPVLREKIKQKFNRGAESQQFLVEAVVGIHTLKAAAVEPMMQLSWEEKLAAYVKSSFEATLLATIGQNAMTYVSTLTTAMIIFYGAQAVIAGQMTVGELVAFNMISGQVVQPILRLSQFFQDFQQIQVSVERLGDILNAPMEVTPQNVSAPPPAKGAIEFKSVQFRYRPGTQPVLSDVSLTIAPGEVVGVVGPSGSGKSTLTKLLQRLYSPDQGQVLVDGVDVAQMDPAWLRRQIGVVLQENILFNRTIHDNIALANPAMPRALVIQVAQLAGAHEFIARLPQGYDTMIEERGANLSGGQRQRIAIARALATNPRILIFDEATSALDYDSERIIHTNMREIVKGRSTIIIAHRLLAVRNCNRIVGIVDGRVVEQGSHEELLKRPGGLYAHLWSLQNDGGGELTLSETLQNIPAKVNAAMERVLPHVDDRAFLPAAVEIIETPPSPHAITTTLAICGFLAAAMIWCYFGRLDVYATARGKIEPAGHAKIVGALDPGKVAIIGAGEGKTVQAGDVLIALDTSEPEAEFASATQAMIAAKSEALRRQAVLAVVASGDWNKPYMIDWPKDIPAAMQSREEHVMQGDLQEQSAKLANLAAQKAEKEAAVKQLNDSIDAENQLMVTLKDRVALRQVLIDKDVGTKTLLYDAIQSQQQQQAQLAGDIGKRDQAIAAVKSVDTQITETSTSFVSDQTRQMATARRLSDEKGADAVKAKVRIDRMTMRSPVDGVVQSLAVTTIGQVVTTGQELMSIVPSDAPPQIVAYVTNDDIGFVTPGDQAVVKIDSFPFTRYGTIEARVDEIARDAIPSDTANQRLTDPTKGDTKQGLTPTARPTTDLVFEARLTPSARAIEINGREVPLSPGMTVTVEIKTGSRRILEYLFSPLVEVAGKAMRER